jgi:hypothetical protein
LENISRAGLRLRLLVTSDLDIRPLEF